MSEKTAEARLPQNTDRQNTTQYWSQTAGYAFFLLKELHKKSNFISGFYVKIIKDAKLWSNGK